jgi:integrase
VRQLPSRRWQAKYPGPDGKARPAPQTFDTRQDAEAWLKVQARQVSAGTWSAGDDVHGTFGQYAEAWLVERPLKPTTRADYRRILDASILPTFKDVPLEALTVASVKAWHKQLPADKPTARAHAYGLLRTVLQTAYQDDIIPANPCRIRGAGTVTRATRTDVPTAVQVHALADEMGITRNNDGSTRVLAGGKYRVMTLVAAWCGLRFGEVTELRRKDVVYVEGEPARIRVRRGVVRVEGEFLVQTPKSGAGVRDVGIPPHVRADVAAYLEQLPNSAEALLFPGSRKGQHMAPSSLYKPFYRARERVGLPSLRWHDLRHFSATTAAGTGATLAELQARLGHSTTQAAMRYQHAASDSDARITAAMSNVVPIRRGA